MAANARVEVWHVEGRPFLVDAPEEELGPYVVGRETAQLAVLFGHRPLNLSGGSPASCSFQNGGFRKPLILSGNKG